MLIGRVDCTIFLVPVRFHYKSIFDKNITSPVARVSAWDCNIFSMRLHARFRNRMSVLCSTIVKYLSFSMSAFLISSLQSAHLMRFSLLSNQNAYKNASLNAIHSFPSISTSSLPQSPRLIQYIPLCCLKSELWCRTNLCTARCTAWELIIVSIGCIMYFLFFSEFSSFDSNQKVNS